MSLDPFGKDINAKVPGQTVQGRKDLLLLRDLVYAGDKLAIDLDPVHLEAHEVRD